MQRLAEDGLDRARAGPRQLRRDAARPPPREPADDVHPARCAARGRVPSSRVLTRVDPAVHARPRPPRSSIPPRRAGRRPPPRCAWPTASRSRSSRRSSSAPARTAVHGRRPRARLAPRGARRGPGSCLRRGTGHDRARPPRRPRTPGCSAIRPATRCSSSGGSSSTTHGRRIEATESRYPADRYALDVAVRRRAAPADRGPTSGADPLMAPDRASRGRLVLDDRRRRRADRRSRTAGSPRSTSRRPPRRRQATRDGLPCIAPGFVDVHVHGWGGHDAMGDRAASTGWPAPCSATASPRSCRPP